MKYQSVLVCLFATIATVEAVITPQVQAHLVNLANAEIQKQLVNGSDMKNANQSVQLQRSFAKIV
jgi:capsular polysaccharide biosynthesis protein